MYMYNEQLILSPKSALFSLFSSFQWLWNTSNCISRTRTRNTAFKEHRRIGLNWILATETIYRLYYCTCTFPHIRRFMKVLIIHTGRPGERNNIPETESKSETVKNLLKHSNSGTFCSFGCSGLPALFSSPFLMQRWNTKLMNALRSLRSFPG